MSGTQAAKLLSDRLQNAQPGERVELWIYSAIAKDPWVAHKVSDATHAEHPGTAIQMGEELYEVMVAEETAEPGYVVRYGMKRWDPHHAVRQLVRYTPTAQAQAAANYLHEARTQALRTRILWLFPLAGLAPDPVQRDWGQRTALNMTWISAGSALMGLAVAFTLRQILGSSPEQQAALYVMYYIAVESFLRLLWTVTTLKPHGSPLLTIPYLLWEAVVRPENRAQKIEAWVKFSYEGDEVIRRPGTGCLVIRSMLFDDLLAGPHAVHFEGAVYRPLHWHQEGKGLVRRWVFELEKIEADSAFGGVKYREYTQPRTPERQKAVEAFTHKLDVAQSFALLWGMYPRRDQVRLQILYQFAAAKFTALTSGIFLAVALLQIWMSTLLHTTIFALAAPVYLILESLYRLYQSQVHGEPAGCIIGYVLRLLVRPPR
jgi:hypothetical protein